MKSQKLVGTVGACPHCGVKSVRYESPWFVPPDMHEPVQSIDVRFGSGASYGNLTQLIIANPNKTVNPHHRVFLDFAACPNCAGIVVAVTDYEDGTTIAYPKKAIDPKVHDSVPKEIAKDYIEARHVKRHSPRASAALARRCLEAILVANGATGSLENMIDATEKELPRGAKEIAHNVRKLGNIAVHIKEHKATGVIVDIEKSEADWMLAFIDALFEHFYVRKAEDDARLQQVIQKIASAQNKKT